MILKYGSTWSVNGVGSSFCCCCCCCGLFWFCGGSCANHVAEMNFLNVFNFDFKLYNVVLGVLCCCGDEKVSFVF